jgi:small-conductance mechanosensitive channel
LSVGSNSLAACLADLGPAAMSFGLPLAVAAAIFLAVTALARLARTRGLVGRSLAGFVKWLTAVILLVALQAAAAPDLARRLDTAFTLAMLAAVWLACRHGVDFVHAKFFLGRGKSHVRGHVLKDLVKFLILVVLAGVGLKDVLDIQLGSLLTSSAILTAVIGLSMQDTIGSLVSGLLLQTEKPFQVGDWIKVGNLEGQVKEMTWRYTKVVTLDANEVLLPNNAVAKERLLNYNRPEAALRRMVCVPAPMDAPPVMVKSAILTALDRAEEVLREPAPMVRLLRMRQDHLVYAAIFYVNRLNAAFAASDAVLSAVWYQFLERDIEIPAPSRRVFSGERAQRHATPEQLAALGEVALLAGMTEADLDMLIRASVTRRFAAGQTIITKGETGTTMSIVLTGEVAVLVDGRELARLTPGQIFGEMALLTGAPRLAEVRAMVHSRCLEVDREGFRMVLSLHPEIVERVRRICQDRAAVAKSGEIQEAAAEGNALFSLFKRLFP